MPKFIKYPYRGAVIEHVVQDKLNYFQIREREKDDDEVRLEHIYGPFKSLDKATEWWDEQLNVEAELMAL